MLPTALLSLGCRFTPCRIWQFSAVSQKAQAGEPLATHSKFIRQMVTDFKLKDRSQNVMNEVYLQGIHVAGIKETGAVSQFHP